MIGLLTRIGARYMIGALAGFLIYANVPPAVVEALTSDPEITLLAVSALAAAIEGATVLARRWGWLT